MGERLRDLMAGPAQHIDLAEAALLVASHAYPDIDVAHYRKRIAEMGASLGERVDLKSDLPGRISELNRYFFRELGFAPNADDYYDPRNSFLNEVLERRTGIPITLCVLYMELGRGVGLPLQGVSFPGHFLVKCSVPDGTVILDPYSLGVSLDLKDLRDRLREFRGGDVGRAMVTDLLVGADNKEIILRLLRNLKAIYLRGGKPDQVLPIMDWIVAATPREASELRDRGMIYQELECFRAAIADFENYLKRKPASADAQDIRSRLSELRLQASRLN